jgi:N-acetylmuramoyl-L-alanine amidase
MKVIERAEWGARPPKWSERLTVTPRHTFLHYNGPAVSNNVYAGDYAGVCGFLRGIQNYHMDTQGWPDVAYSFAADSMGRLYRLRGWNVAQAATLNWNWQSHSVLLVLGGEQQPTAPMIGAVNTVIREAIRLYGPQTVLGHQQAPNSTSCPGGPVMRLIGQGVFNGALNPEPEPEPEIEIEDDDMSKVVVDVRPGRSAWHVAGNTRYRLENEHEVHQLLVRGAELVKADPNNAAEVQEVVTFLRAHKDIGRP